MRVQVGKSLPVKAGDSAELIARLRSPSDLARLFVFAREYGNDEFSPYVPGLVEKLGVSSDKPQMFSPLMLRVTGPGPRKLAFKVDIDGELRVMQEIDVASDPLARVRFKIVPDSAVFFSVKRWRNLFLSR